MRAGHERAASALARHGFRPAASARAGRASLPRQESEPLSVVDDPPPSVQIESGWLPAQLELRSTNVDH